MTTSYLYLLSETMDRARGKFSKGDSYSHRVSDGYNGPYHRSDNSPRPGPSRIENGSNGSNNPRPDYGVRNGVAEKRNLEPSETSDGQMGKRHRAEPAHGTANKRRVRIDLEVTKPADVPKSGHGTKDAEGQAVVRLKANYFQLTNRPNFVVYQYHVDIEPEISSTQIKKGIFYECTKNISGGKIFDGTTLYTTTRLGEDLMILNGIRKQRNSNDPVLPVTIKIKFVKEISSFQEMGIFQVLNTVLRQALRGLDLQLVGRNYFDAKARNTMRELKLEVWPGYITSIRQHDANILMCCETTSKVMRNETLYEILKRCQENYADYRKAYKAEVVGMTVLTDYNNKTYRIDDIEWNQNPQSTFDTKNGPKSYVQYYGEVSKTDKCKKNVK